MPSSPTSPSPSRSRPVLSSRKLTALANVDLAAGSGDGAYSSDPRGVGASLGTEESATGGFATDGNRGGTPSSVDAGIWANACCCSSSLANGVYLLRASNAGRARANRSGGGSAAIGASPSVLLPSATRGRGRNAPSAAWSHRWRWRRRPQAPPSLPRRPPSALVRRAGPRASPRASPDAHNQPRAPRNVSVTGERTAVIGRHARPLEGRRGSNTRAAPSAFSTTMDLFDLDLFGSQIQGDLIVSGAHDSDLLDL